MILGIIGSGKSGTTFITKSLINSGFEGRMDGNAEDWVMRGVNETILRDYGADTQSKFPYGHLPKNEIRVSPDHKDLLPNINRVCSSNVPKVVKDPRTTLLHRYWLPRFDSFIGVFRHPHEVVRGYARDMRVMYDSQEEAVRIHMDYWKRFNKSLLFCLKKYKKGYLVEFDLSIKTQLDAVFDDMGIIRPDYVLDKRRQLPCGEVINDTEASGIYRELKKYKYGI